MHSGPSCICVLKLVEVCIGAAISVTLVRPEVCGRILREMFILSLAPCAAQVFAF